MKARNSIFDKKSNFFKDCLSDAREDCLSRQASGRPVSVDSETGKSSLKKKKKLPFQLGKKILLFKILTIWVIS